MIFTLKCVLEFDPPFTKLWAKIYALLQLYRAIMPKCFLVMVYSMK